jgi:hypothetical protein
LPRDGLENLRVFAPYGVQKSLSLFRLALTTSDFDIKVDMIQLVEGNYFKIPLGNQFCG